MSTEGDRSPDLIAERVALPIEIRAYDPAWPAAFEALRRDLQAALGDTAIAIEHLGSTAVPGLDAVPVLDVAAVIRSEGDLPRAVAQLAAAGYTYVGDLGVQGRAAFTEPPAAAQMVHRLYVMAAGSKALQRHLAFRDMLRRDGALAARYGALKHRLAEQFREDSDGYVEGKTVFMNTAVAALRGEDRALRRK